MFRQFLEQLGSRMVRPDRRRHAIFLWPCAMSTRAVVRAGALRPGYDCTADCHLRCRAPATRVAGPAPPLRARGRSRTSTGPGPAPCSRGPSSRQGQCSRTAGGLSSSAGPAPRPRGPSSGQGQCAPNTTTSPTRLSPPPPCAGRTSGRPGADSASTCLLRRGVAPGCRGRGGAVVFAPPSRPRLRATLTQARPPQW